MRWKIAGLFLALLYVDILFWLLSLFMKVCILVQWNCGIMFVGIKHGYHHYMNTWHYTFGTKVTNKVSNFSPFRGQWHNQNFYREKFVFSLNDFYCLVICISGFSFFLGECNQAMYYPHIYIYVITPLPFGALYLSSHVNMRYRKSIYLFHCLILCDTLNDILLYVKSIILNSML